MTYVFAKHDPYWDTGHLGKVIDEMKLTGAPTIRVVKCGENFIAIEGSHRLFAAWHLGLNPKLVILDTDGVVPYEWWGMVIQNLPKYNFDYVYSLNLSEINDRTT